MSTINTSLLLVAVWLVWLSHGAVVSYVPNATCTTTSGCDFNSNIWNITGVPAVNDIVYITSIAQITIFANNSYIQLSYLSFGPNVQFVLYNSTLAVYSNYIAMNWQTNNGTSVLVLEGSNLHTNAIVYGDWLVVSEGLVNVTEIMLSATGDFTNSTVLAYSFQTNMLYSSDSSWVVSFLQVSNGQVFGGDCAIGSLTLLTHGTVVETISFYDTTATFGELGFDGIGPNLYFSSPSTTSPTSFKANIDCINGCASEEFYSLHFSFNVTANLSGNIPPIYVDYGSITLNLFSEGSPTVLRDVQKQLSNVGPFFRLNIYGTVIFDLDFSLLATITMGPTGVILVNDDLNLESISGEGTLSFRGGNLYTGPYVSAGEIYFASPGSLYNPSDLFVSYLHCANSVRPIVINAGSTTVSYPGVNLASNNSITFKGAYSQTNGWLNFTYSPSLGTNTSLLEVNEDVSLVGVIINCDNLQGYNGSRISLIRTNGSLLVENTTYLNNDAAIQAQLININRELYVVFSASPTPLPTLFPSPSPTPAPSKRKSAAQIFDENKVTIILVPIAFILVVMIVVLGIRYYRNARKEYAVIN